MTDVNAVNNVVKDINELRKRHRNCKTQNISRDAALTKVMSVRRFAFGKAFVLFLCKRFNFGNFLSDAGMDFFTLA